MPQPAPPRRRLRALTAAPVLALALLVAAPVLPSAAAEGYDYGDAPADFDAGSGDPARALVGGPRLGRTVSADRLDPDTGVSSKASEAGNGDDDDGLALLPDVPVGRLTTLRLEVAVSQVTVPARLCGWVDLDRDRTFETGERACVDVPAGAGSAELRWDGRAGTAGRSFVRLRIATATAQAERSEGRSGSGEVEDHPITFVETAPPPRPALSLDTVASPTRVERVGERVGYTYRIRNRGPVALRAVALSDVRVPADQLRCSPTLGATLDPGAQLTCTADVEVTQDDLDFGALETAAEARAEGPSGDPEDASDDVLAVGPATVQVRARPQLAVAVSTAPGRPGVGDRVSAGVTVTNRGNLTLTGVRLDALRPRLRGITCAPTGAGELAPGAGLTCTGSFVVGAADARRGRLTVRVGARGEEPYGIPETTRDDVVASAAVEVPLTRLEGGTDDVGADSGPGPDRDAGTGPHTGPPVRGDGLADSGGPSPALPVAGLLALVVGVVLLGRRTRLARRRR